MRAGLIWGFVPCPVTPLVIQSKQNGPTFPQCPDGWFKYLLFILKSKLPGKSWIFEPIFSPTQEIIGGWLELAFSIYYYGPHLLADGSSHSRWTFWCLLKVLWHQKSAGMEKLELDNPYNLQLFFLLLLFIFKNWTFIFWLISNSQPSSFNVVQQIYFLW